jgi:hypothetical protein
MLAPLMVAIPAASPMKMMMFFALGSFAQQENSIGTSRGMTRFKECSFRPQLGLLHAGRAGGALGNAPPAVYQNM